MLASLICPGGVVNPGGEGRGQLMMQSPPIINSDDDSGGIFYDINLITRQNSSIESIVLT